MHRKITYAWVTDQCICVLLVMSMLSVVRIEIAGFPVYSLLLLFLASVWALSRIIFAGREGFSFLTVRYRTDTAALAVILYALVSTVIRLFSVSTEEGIDFSWNAEVIALALICLLVSSEMRFKMLHLDLLLYSGLLTAGFYMLVNLTD